MNGLWWILSAICGVLLIIRFSGFNIAFSPSADVFICISLSAIILALTIFSMKAKCKSTKTSLLMYGFLPGLSIVFVLLVNDAVNTYAYLVLYPVTLVCGMVLFFSGTRHLLVKTLFGVAYLLVIIPIALVLLSMTVNFSNTVIQSSISPSGHYKAELWAHRRGLNGISGSATWIYMTRQPDSINIFFAELQRRPSRIYSSIDGGRWANAYGMTLYWEDDNLLRVDWERDTHPRIDFPLRFHYYGQRWIREYPEP